MMNKWMNASVLFSSLILCKGKRDYVHAHPTPFSNPRYPTNTSFYFGCQHDPRASRSTRYA
jgi:hypothetical protein